MVPTADADRGTVQIEARVPARAFRLSFGEKNININLAYNLLLRGHYLIKLAFN